MMLQQEQQQHYHHRLLVAGDNGGNATNDTTSLVFDTDIDYRYMPDRMYYGLAAAGIFSCLLSLLGATFLLYFLLISNPRNGKKRSNRNSSSTASTQPEHQEKKATFSFQSVRNVFRKKSNDSTHHTITSNSTRGDAQEKLSLYHRLLVGLSVMDWVTSLSLAMQPILVPPHTHYPLALGNKATCRMAAFWFQGSIGSYLYSAALSLYFYYTIRRGKKEKEAAAILEPYAHIVSIAIPILLSVLGLSLDMFHPSVVFMDCYFVFPHEKPECVMSTPAQQEANDLHCTTSSAQFAVAGSLPVIAAVAVFTGMVVTVLVYRTVRQQTLLIRRHSFDGQVSDPQMNRTRAVCRQAILYFLVYLSGFLVTVLTSNMAVASGRKIGDPTDMYGSTMLHVSIFLVYIFFPLQGFWNCIIFMRPRVVKWKDAEPEKSWFWCFRKVLSGYPAPGRRANRNAERLSAGNRWGLSSTTPSNQNPESRLSASGDLPSSQFVPSTPLPQTQTRRKVVDASCLGSMPLGDEGNVPSTRTCETEEQTTPSDRSASDPMSPPIMELDNAGENSHPTNTVENKDKTPNILSNDAEPSFTNKLDDVDGTRVPSISSESKVQTRLPDTGSNDSKPSSAYVLDDYELDEVHEEESTTTDDF